MTLESLPEPALRRVLPLLEDLRHDLGKYVCFETRFAGPDADLPTLRAALRADLLATRRHGARVEAAWELWARLRTAAVQGGLPAQDPDVEALDQALDLLRAADLDGDRAALDAVAAQAERVRALTRRLHDRARQAASALGLDPDEP
ncbi:hypothetical protein L6R53_15535 [Myxococcota bacterium]|nr:hypothetical protein [Myxococcota bacterium]